MGMPGRSRPPQVVDPQRGHGLGAAPAVAQLALMAVAPLPFNIPLTTDSFFHERHMPVVGVVLWCLTIVLVLYFKVVPDFATRRVRQKGKQVFARVVALNQSSHSYRKLALRFPNLNGTEVSDSVAFLGGKGLLPQLKGHLGWQQRQGAYFVPIWLNPRIAEPRYAFAFQNGWRTQADYLWALGFFIITALHIVGPALWIVQHESATFDEFPRVVSDVAHWIYAPALILILVWICCSKSSGLDGPTGASKTDFVLTGMPATTDGYTWKQTHYSSDSIAYRFTVHYRDQDGRAHEVSFTETGRDLPTFSEVNRARENDYLQQLPQQRPILYLTKSPQHIWFRDNINGNIFSDGYRD